MFCQNLWAPAVAAEYTTQQFWNGSNNPRRIIRVFSVQPFAVGGSLGISAVMTSVQHPNLVPATALDLDGLGRTPQYTLYDADSQPSAPSGFSKVQDGIAHIGGNIFPHPVTILPGQGLILGAANSNASQQLTIAWKEIFIRRGL